MNTAERVTELISGWTDMSKSEKVIKIAKACLGWSYVWGGYGQLCTPSNRKGYAERTSCPAAESAVIVSKCQVLRNSKSKCDGCTYYPGGATRFFDCRGFTRWVLSHVGINLQGAGATSQWNDNTNWTKKGPISELPDRVCVLFWQDKKDKSKMGHTGLYLGGNVIIHCSGEVKYDTLDTKGWTHYAIPRGIDGDVPVWRPTIRKGSSGDDVKYCQQLLMKLGYDLSPYNDDGRFGTKTLNAVLAFQKANGLGVDGVVGPMTWDALTGAKPVTTEPAKTYSVTIKGLSKAKADSLKKDYPNATIKEE